MGEGIKVEDIMTRDPIAMTPFDTIAQAAKIFEEHGFSGIPVVTDGKKLVGLVTSYDMILHSRQHIPNVLGVLSGSDGETADPKKLEEHFSKLKEVRVRDIMNADPLVVYPEVKVGDLVGEFAEHHKVNPVLVIDREKNLIGVVSRYDLVRCFSQRHVMDVMEDASGHHGILQRLTRAGEKGGGEE
jgi:CBS domain-containing protein